MTKTLFAGVLSAAIALSGIIATPARADNEDVAKALAAIAAIALIGAAIDHRNDRRNQAAAPPPPPPPPRLEALPSDCVFEYWGRGGPDHALSTRCIAEEMRHPERLPQACQIEVQVQPSQERGRAHSEGHGRSRHDRFRSAYDIRCLTGAGYRFDR